MRAPVINYLVALVFIWMAGKCYAEPEIVPFQSDRWEINAIESRIEQHLGRESLFMKCDFPVKCFAVVKDSEFTDGVIEFDIAFENRDERGFIGVAWRIQDDKNYEEFYFRPHHSEEPDANQYIPVINGVASWQLYYGEGYSAPSKYVYNEWMPVKIVVSGDQAEVYVMEMDKPALFIPELKRNIRSGKVALKMDLGNVHYSKFRYTATSSLPIKSTREWEATPAGTIMSWLVSEAFEETALDSDFLSLREVYEQNSWYKLDSERYGLANLARVQGLNENRNCAFARTVAVSSREQVKGLEFGFSQRIKVYLNGQPIYRGNNTFRTRDHRYLGTIGYFDTLYLPLKKGDNELWMAVCDSLGGGWGIQARFTDLESLSFRD